MKVKELIRELQKFDGELRVFASADMMDVWYGEVVDVNFTKKLVLVNNIKEDRVELEFTDTFE